ncbi:RNA polymerase sigma factor [Pseudokineococcus basanitobsidens]|uniref:RNA polymerase sigma factor n=1 Tax=Pseudokineococcus basanitobsidens TaxID=1926649 RepID=A0ABU8RIM1_9ACTN
MEGPPDRQLWQRASAGDGDAFGVLFDRHHEAVRAYCARRTGSLDAADDMVSITFLEAWRRRSDVELVHDSVLPWLYGVAGNTVRRRTRTAMRHRRLLDRLPQENVTPDHAKDVATRLDDTRELERVTAALIRLRRIDQEVLVLCLWQGLDYASAAVALGVPVGTVRSRLSRARTRLGDATALMAPPHPDPPSRPHGDSRATRSSTPTATATPTTPMTWQEQP